MQGISVVTGTLNRKEYLPDLISNTVDSGSTVNVELVLVDGGSTDGTIEYLEQLNHPNIKLIKYGQRSSYPHYMNLGVKNASYDLICQWNDDVLLINSWDQVLNQIDNEHDAYLFSWKIGSVSDMTNPDWLRCEQIRDNNWIIINNADYSQIPGEQTGEVVMNYGIYKKDVFRKYGLYSPNYQYYCADGEMTMRAYYSGCKFKNCISVKVLVLPAEKRAIMTQEDVKRYYRDCFYYNLLRLLPDITTNMTMKPTIAGHGFTLTNSTDDKGFVLKIISKETKGDEATIADIFHLVGGEYLE